MRPRLAEKMIRGRLSAYPADADVDAVWLQGGLPDGSALHPDRFPQWQHDYLALLVQRDLPAWWLPARPQQTSRPHLWLDYADAALRDASSWESPHVGAAPSDSAGRYLDGDAPGCV